MMGRLFWLVTAGLVAVATHIFTIMYVPGIMFQRNFDRLLPSVTQNALVILTPKQAEGLLPGVTGSDVVGLCMLDVSKGTALVRANVPSSLWNFAIYGGDGQQAYGINDVGASTGTFEVRLSQAKSVYKQLTGKPDAEDANVISDVGWHAQVNGTKAYAVLWVPVPDVSRRAELEAAVRNTNCGAG